MAFEPKTWACGDTIIAQELNRMEQGIVEASDKGYECIIGKETLFDGVANVVSGGEGMYNWQFPNEVTIDADSIEVVFNGTSYNLNKQSHQGSFYYYGEIGQTGPTFITYPFLILVQSTMTELYVPNRGNYNIEVSSNVETTETSECFEKAVKSVIEDASGGTETLIVEISAHAENCGDDYAITADKTYNDILQAFENKKLIVFRTEYWCEDNPHTIASAIVNVSETPSETLGVRYEFHASYYSNVSIRIDPDGTWTIYF